MVERRLARKRSMLKNEGCIRADSPHGLWELSDKGIAQAEAWLAESRGNFSDHLLAMPDVGADADFNPLRSGPRQFDAWVTSSTPTSFRNCGNANAPRRRSWTGWIRGLTLRADFFARSSRSGARPAATPRPRRTTSPCQAQRGSARTRASAAAIQRLRVCERRRDLPRAAGLQHGVEARPPPRVARRAGLVHQCEQRVAVAIEHEGDEMLRLARGLALAPQPPPAPRPVADAAGGERFGPPPRGSSTPA